MRLEGLSSAESWNRLTEELPIESLLVSGAKRPSVWVAPSVMSGLTEVLSSIAWKTLISGAELKTFAVLSKVDPDLDRLAKKIGEVGLSAKAIEQTQWCSGEWGGESSSEQWAAALWTEVDFASGASIEPPPEIMNSLKDKTHRAVKIRLERYAAGSALWSESLGAYEVRVVWLQNHMADATSRGQRVNGSLSSAVRGVALVVLGERLKPLLARTLPFSWTEEALRSVAEFVPREIMALQLERQRSEVDRKSQLARFQQQMLKHGSVESCALGGLDGSAGAWVTLKNGLNGGVFLKSLLDSASGGMTESDVKSLSQLAHQDPGFADWLLHTKGLSTRDLTGRVWISSEAILRSASSVTA